jgi:hypothetical protein
MALNIVSGSSALPKQVHAAMLGGYMANDAAGNAYQGLPVVGVNGVVAADATAGAALPAGFSSNNSSILDAISYAASSTTYEEGPGIDISSQVVKLDFAGTGASELPAHTLAATSVLAAAVASGVTQQFSATELGTFLAGDGLSAALGVLAVGVDGSSIEITADTLNVKALGVTNAMLAGSIANAKLLNSTISGISLGSNLGDLSVDDSTLALDSGTTFNGSAGRSITVKDAGITATQLATSVAGGGLTGGGGSVLAVGAGTGITVNADDVAINTAQALNWTATQKFDTDVLQIEGTNSSGTADKYFAMKVEGGILVLTEQA